MHFFVEVYITNYHSDSLPLIKWDDQYFNLGKNLANLILFKSHSYIMLVILSFLQAIKDHFHSQKNSQGVYVKHLYFTYLTILRKVASHAALLQSTSDTSKKQVKNIVILYQVKLTPYFL